MLYQICGKVVKVRANDNGWVVSVMTEAGIAFEINVSSRFPYVNVNEDVCVFTTLVVREDSMTLFGFEDELGREWFDRLRNVSGVGPKTALNIIGTYAIDDLVNILKNSDVSMLTKVKGLGAKGAKKIILELQGVIASTDDSQNSTVLSELKKVLQSLGFSGEELAEMMDNGKQISEKNPDIAIEDIVQRVLQAR